MTLMGGFDSIGTKKIRWYIFIFIFIVNILIIIIVIKTNIYNEYDLNWWYLLWY